MHFLPIALSGWPYENVAQLGRRGQKLCSEAAAEGAIGFHQSGWSLQPFPLSALWLVLEEDNQGGGELRVAGSGRQMHLVQAVLLSDEPSLILITLDLLYVVL